MLEAGRHVIERPVPARSSEDAAGFAPELRRRKAGEGVKASAERSQAFVTRVEADIGDAVIAGQQQLLGVIDPQPRHKLVRCFVEGVREKAMEVERRQFSLRCRFSQRGTLVKPGGQIVASEAQAAEMRHVMESPTCAG